MCQRLNTGESNNFYFGIFICIGALTLRSMKMSIGIRCFSFVYFVWFISGTWGILVGMVHLSSIFLNVQSYMEKLSFFSGYILWEDARKSYEELQLNVAIRHGCMVRYIIYLASQYHICTAKFLAPNLKGLGAYNLVSVCTSVLPWTAISQKCMDQIVWHFTQRLGMIWGLCTLNRFLISFKMAAWRPWCKHTWSRNSNNTNWLYFKLGAERKLGMVNMYAHLFSVQFQKWRHGGHICFLTPMVTLFWPISRKLCKIGD